MEQKHRKGKMKVDVKTEDGVVLTKEHGFTVHEEMGSVLSFDLVSHPEYGTVLLFANSVCLLKFWQTEQLQEAKNIVNKAIDVELNKRKVQDGQSF